MRRLTNTELETYAGIADSLADQGDIRSCAYSNLVIIELLARQLDADAGKTVRKNTTTE
jgi:hypothetical protein